MIVRGKSRHCQTWLPSSVTPSGMKTHSESRIELRHLRILKKMLEKSSPFFPSEQPCEPKSLDVSLKIAGVEKITSENFVVVVILEAIWFEFWMKGAQMTVEIFVLCGWWFSNQFDIVSETHFSCDTVGRELCVLVVLWCAPKGTETFASESKVMCLCYLILRSGVLMEIN